MSKKQRNFRITGWFDGDLTQKQCDPAVRFVTDNCFLTPGSLQEILANIDLPNHAVVDKNRHDVTSCCIEQPKIALDLSLISILHRAAIAKRPYQRMSQPMTNIAILGSTGSIGTNTLEVVRALAPRFRVVGLSAHTNLKTLGAQALEFQPDWVVGTNLAAWDQCDFPELDHTKRYAGPQDLESLVQENNVDTIVAAMVGSAGLASTFAAIQSGKRIALANKETLVMAGHQMMAAAKENQAQILPVDSEHSAVFQAIGTTCPNQISKVVLTASGGPFRDFSSKDMEKVTVKQALSHPTWKMGKKISIDSATMMNKALEIIEARWLFGLPIEKLGVVIHPQSIVHSLVEFIDGSVMTQMSPPDMKLPIQYALTYPERSPGPAAKTDWNQSVCHEFIPPDFERFPALELGFEVAERGGTTGAVLNAANETAVEAFLNGQIGFTDIVSGCRKVLKQHEFDPNPDLDDLIKIDAWARRETAKWISD